MEGNTEKRRVKSIIDWFKRLFERPAAQTVDMPLWVKIAMKDIGVVERKGDAHNKRILEFHASVPEKYDSDEVPWCASAVTTWLEESGMKSMKSARARAYEEYGKELSEPRFGCVATFYRGYKTSRGGHVGFYLGKVRDQVVILGGNQGDAVSIVEYPESRLLGYRWPVERRI